MDDRLMRGFRSFSEGAGRRDISFRRKQPDATEAFLVGGFGFIRGFRQDRKTSRLFSGNYPSSLRDSASEQIPSRCLGVGWNWGSNCKSGSPVQILPSWMLLEPVRRTTASTRTVRFDRPAHRRLTNLRRQRKPPLAPSRYRRVTQTPAVKNCCSVFLWI